MNKKSICAVLLILLLAAVSILGLPLLVRSIEHRAENTSPVVTVAPAPVYEDMVEGAGT